MESNNYNGIHIISEAVVVGGVAMYFYKKISEMETTIEDLKAQVTMQNNQIRYLIGSTGLNQSSSHVANNARITPLYHRSDGQQGQITSQRQPHRKAPPPPQVQQECEGGVCKLVPQKVVSISKISRQIEFDRENMESDQTSKVKTFVKSSPNPLLKSVTPNPSTSMSELEEGAGQLSELDKILNAIDNE